MLMTLFYPASEPLKICDHRIVTQ